MGASESKQHQSSFINPPFCGDSCVCATDDIVCPNGVPFLYPVAPGSQMLHTVCAPGNTIYTNVNKPCSKDQTLVTFPDMSDTACVPKDTPLTTAERVCPSGTTAIPNTHLCSYDNVQNAECKTFFYNTSLNMQIPLA